LRMRGLFNNNPRMIELADWESFNPPCGCVAFSTTWMLSGWNVCVDVSIRLADAWPFQPLPRFLGESDVDGFNPPCGCVAFST